MSVYCESELGSVCYDLLYAIGWQSRYSQVKKHLCSSVFAMHVYCSHCAHNREVLYLTVVVSRAFTECIMLTFLYHSVRC
jgi:hypothetical protein